VPATPYGLIRLSAATRRWAAKASPAQSKAILSSFSLPIIPFPDEDRMSAVPDDPEYSFFAASPVGLENLNISGLKSAVIVALS